MKLLNIDGFNVLHIPHHSDLITVRVAISAGSTNEAFPADYGVAHYLEHLFFKGTTTKNYNELNKKMAKLGMSNAYTNFSKTVFYINTIKTGLADAADLLAELVFDPAFDEKEFDKERNVILEELQSYQDDPGSYFHYQSFQHIFGQQGHEIIGTQESVSNMKLEQLVDFRNSFYTKDNLVFIIAGNVAEKEVEQVMRTALLRGKKCNEKVARTKPQNAIDWTNDSKQFNHAAQQAYMSLNFRGPTMTDEKVRHQTPDLFNNIFGGGLYSILGNKVREELGLCYSIWATESGYENLKTFVVGTQLKKENVEKAKDAILGELANVQKIGFDEDLIATGKANVIYRITKQGETAGGMAAMFGDNFLNMRKAYDMNEMNVKYFIDQIMSHTDNDTLIEYANWIGEKGHKFIFMTPA